MNVMSRIEPGPAAAEHPPPAADRGWRAALVVLGLGTLAWGLLFGGEIAAAVRMWDASTAYNHCWLILPIAAWLFWQRRGRLAGLAPAPDWRLALLAAPGTIAWLAAERLGIMEGRQFGALGLFYVLVLAVLGWRFARAFAGPLLYLVFLVPFGEFAVPLLQNVTVRFIDLGLDLFGISHYIDDLLIETPSGRFYVAEACAGLRFIIAALAFGALYALVIFRSFWRRATVMVLAVAVPIIANGIRALGIIVMAEWIGSAEAAAAHHVLVGWTFFSIVLVLLILAGLPFREDAAPPAPAPAGWRALLAPRPAALAAGGILAVGLIAAGPLAAAGLAYRAGNPASLGARLAPPAGCIAAADALGLDCQGIRVTARLLQFSPQVNWSAVSAARWQAIESTDNDLIFGVPIPGGGAWHARQHAQQPGAVAVAAWLDGRAVGQGLGARLAQAENSLFGDRGRPVLAVVTVTSAAGALAPDPAARAVLEAVLAAQADALVAEAAGLSRNH